MNEEEVENWAADNHLDVRPIQDYHYRIMDEFGEYVLDIYFKKNKSGNVVKNATLQWKTNKWFTPRTLEELDALIK